MVPGIEELVWRYFLLVSAVSWWINKGWGAVDDFCIWRHCFEFPSAFCHWWFGDMKGIRPV